MPTPDKAREKSYSGDYMQAGEETERIIAEWLKSRDGISRVDDLRKDRVMQQADVDFAVHLKSGHVWLIEAKSDKHLGISQNVLFEILRIYHTAPPEYCAGLGWAAKSPATHVIYHAPSVSKLYVFEMKKLRAAFQSYTGEARKRINLNIVETDKAKTTVNVLIPMKYCEGSYREYELRATEGKNSAGEESQEIKPAAMKNKQPAPGESKQPAPESTRDEKADIESQKSSKPPF